MSAGSAKRIKAIIEQSGLSVRRLADEIGVSNVSIYKWLNGRTPEGDRLKSFCEYFKVTPAFVIYGDSNDERGQSIPIDENRVSIPILDINASCGCGLEIPPDVPIVKMIDVDNSFFNEYLYGANRRSLHIIHAVGDSMAPTIKEGNPVIVDTSDKRLNRDGIFAFVFNSGLFIKRVQCLPDGVALLSDNKLYDPIKITEQDSLKVVGRCYCGFNIDKF